MGSIHEKSRGKKISCYCPFKEKKLKIDKRIFRLNGNFPEDFLHTVDRNMNTA
jgi:hypothetical protein